MVRPEAFEILPTRHQIVRYPELCRTRKFQAAVAIAEKVLRAQKKRNAQPSNKRPPRIARSEPLRTRKMLATRPNEALNVSSWIR